jgi:acetyl esterase/lipase
VTADELSEISREAQAVLDRMRARRISLPTPTVAAIDLEHQRTLAERFGETTVAPVGVRYDTIDAAGVRAEWVTPSTAASEGVLVYFHGGGYCHGSMSSRSRLVGHIVNAARCRALNVDFRLAPEHPHPAALDDGLAVYRWLLAQEIAPEQIVAAGDSAGAGLALAVALAARDQHLPPLAGCVMISAWVDMALTAPSITSRANVDPLQSRAVMEHCIGYFLGDRDRRDPSASPLYADLTGLPPLYIQTGDADLLMDDSTRLASKARKAGVDVRLDVFPHMPHIHQMWAGMMPEADEAIACIGGYLRERFRASHDGRATRLSFKPSRMPEL